MPYSQELFYNMVCLSLANLLRRDFRFFVFNIQSDFRCFVFNIQSLFLIFNFLCKQKYHYTSSEKNHLFPSCSRSKHEQTSTLSYTLSKGIPLNLASCSIFKRLRSVPGQIRFLLRWFSYAPQTVITWKMKNTIAFIVSTPPQGSKKLEIFCTLVCTFFWTLLRLSQLANGY